ncbi:phosphopentomutase [Sedimentitalea todarodis]|uniref:Phosphopentomutase n=1 Tax=Sedimentitalea todarodis TaxID=1631240 RepID=A0ABU3VCT6_9RHOB|nr:phosphopentomutase [Sedimentitalea todarodis]MDU9003990.1 phosphopentomutase [Sedimentitalea todarodis]
MARAFLVVMDSVGIGGAPDAGRYYNGTVPDTGANTVAHIAQACMAGRAERGRSGALKVPHLDQLGLGAAVRLASGFAAPGLGMTPAGAWGAATEVSRGKDTPSGHWELAGVPVPWDWHFFPDDLPAFPDTLARTVAQAAGTGGILGNCHASGTRIIAELGPEHLRTGWPICYTSADSVFQIAAHEEHFGLDRLLTLCAEIAPRLHAQKVGRVIARPFIGRADTGFIRTSNRKDYAITPPAPVLTNWVQDAGHRVYAVGKIGDIFSMQGIDDLRKGDDSELMGHLSDLVDDAEDGSLTFANFVEFDSRFGHRRDISGYAAALEWFDVGLGRILARLRPDDIMVLTADHGNDPSWTGTDHTRERVPVLVSGRGARSLGHVGFVDVAASVADHLGVPPRGPGMSFF